MDRFFEERDAKEYAEDYLLLKALKKKYYEYIIGYDHYNPWLGTHLFETTRRGKTFRYFAGLKGGRKLLTLTADCIIKLATGRKHFSDYKPVVKVEIYHF